MLWRVLAALAIAGTVFPFSQATRREVSLLITGATIVTMDSAGRVLSPGAVAIDGRDIVGVGSAESVQAQFAGRDTIDASGQVVIPGLINTHTHAPMVLYRGLADDLALMEWLQKYIFPAEAKTVSPEFVRAGTRLAALEMIQSGTTAYADMYYYEEEIAAATKEAGIRGVLGQTIIQFPVPDAKTPSEGIAQGHDVPADVAGRRPDRAGHRAALDVHARHRDAQGDPCGRRSRARAGDHPPRGNAGRGEDLARESTTPRPSSISNRSASGVRGRSRRTACA